MASDGTIKITTELDNSQAEQAMSKFGKLVKTGIAALGISKIASEIGQLGGYIFQTGLQFESAFAGVEKTVDATDTQLQEFRAGIREMSTEIPQTAADIASVAEAAGQLGIKNDYLLGFTETMSNLGVATNMSATEAATSLARLANITQMPQENFDRLGSTIVALGNNLATTESEITEMGLRLAGAGKQVGMSEAQILGLAGAISSVGIEADAGGSAVSTVMTRMQLAVEQGGESLEQFADVAGMSADEFRQAFQEDAAQALVAFVEGLGTMDERGQSAIGTLSDMEITEIRQRDALLRLAGAGDVLSESLGIATQAWDENNALTNEAEKRYQTLESQIQILKNNVDDFAISLYDGIRDPMAEVVTESIGYVQRLHSAFNTGGISATVAELGEVFDEVTTEIAASSDAAAGVVTPLKNIATIGGNLTKSVLPAIGDGAELIAENFDVLLPTVTGLTAGMKVYTAITKASATATKANAVATAVLNKMEKANALQLVATNGGLTLRQTLLAVYNGQITATTALTGLWTKAQTALNTAMTANPIGLAVTAVAALAAGIGAAVLLTDRATDSTAKLTEKQKASIDASRDAIDSINEEAEARQKNINASTLEIDNAQALWNELQRIVDANGAVKSGYEDRAQYITGALSDALGTEISLTDGVIENYGELQASIYDVIAAKKAEAVLDTMKSDYADAMQEQAEKAATLAEEYEKLTSIKSELSGIEDALAEEEKNATVRYSETGQAVKEYSGEYYELKDRLQEVNGELEVQQAKFDEANAAMQDNQKVISDYNMLTEAVMSGNTDAINAALAEIQSGLDSTLEAGSSAAIEQANTTAETLTSILQGEADGLYSLQNQTKESLAETMGMALNQVGSGAEEMKQVLEAAGQEGSARIIAAMAQAKISGTLSEEAKAGMGSFISGFDGLDEKTKEVWAQAWYGALKGLKGFEQLKDPATEGAEAFLESLRTALDEHSPSKKTEEIFRLAMEGAAQGVESGKEGVLIKAGEFVTAFLGKFTESGLGEKLQGIGANIMSFFGLGVGSQSENSRAAGQANADAANSGAGSVNPFGTGTRFGGLFSGGIGGIVGSIFGVGKSLSDSANSGAGSVNPTSTGSTFGSQYSSGVGGKAGEANAKGKSLADNAKSGADTADGYSSGSNFGSGFVNGIGSWISSAASKAAELAAGALSAAKQALGIASPSKEMKKVGRWFGQGLEEGIKESEAPAEASAAELADKTLDAFDVSGLQVKLRELDIPETMSRVYMAVDDKQNQVAANVAAAVKAQEDLAWKDRGKSQTVRLSDADIERLAKEISKTVSQRPIVVESIINGRAAARALVDPMEQELKRNETTNKRLRGDRS